MQTFIMLLTKSKGDQICIVVKLVAGEAEVVMQRCGSPVEAHIYTLVISLLCLLMVVVERSAVYLNVNLTQWTCANRGDGWFNFFSDQSMEQTDLSTPLSPVRESFLATCPV